MDKWFKPWEDACTREGVATLSCIPTIFLNILSALLMFAGVTALVMFLMGGLKFMNSAGDPKKLEGARNNLTYGIIGLLIIFFSFLLINVIAQVTGVACIKRFGFGCE